MNATSQPLPAALPDRSIQADTAAHVTSASDRNIVAGMMRGARGRCPACGDAPLFSGFLKVRSECSGCGEDLSGQRADDGPAYLTILIVSHLVGPLLMIVYMAWRPSPLSMVAGFCVGATVLSLLLLPRIKGGLVGFQWAKRMHGFGNGEPRL
ncbi:DUF983 domain-containing protein [Paracoccus sp. Z118]|uniref:DUF983 domain-containing protein n=1 Tax=Paracoccus sp. Z118 TaxID=2851017 RepID=UPI0020B690C0|nr:DUF983 domain-containing protein [Paracoccus sp. Z118]